MHNRILSLQKNGAAWPCTAYSKAQVSSIWAEFQGNEDKCSDLQPMTIT